MKTYITSLFLVFILFLPFTLQATVQTKDLLIYKGDTVSISPFPLEYYPLIDTMRDSLFNENPEGWCTTNYRGYQAIWILTDNKLFLTSIQPPYHHKGKSNLSRLFGARYDGQKVFADWYSGELFVSLGKEIYRNGEWYEGVLTEQEEKLTVCNGIITDAITYNNAIKESQYSRNPKLLIEYIYSHIDWDILPIEEHDSIRTIVSFSSKNPDQKIDSVRIVRGESEMYNKELIRVLKLLPEWISIYHRGKYITPFFTMKSSRLI